MSKFQRGVVKKITFEIEYPDGSQKSAQLENAEDISFIAFDNTNFPARDFELFNVSDSDWMQNPAMLIYKNVAIEGIGQGIPFCTHNGCK